MAKSTLTPGRRALVRLSASLPVRDRSILAEAMDEVVSVGEGLAAEEVILQSYLFLGYPVALNAFALWREVAGTVPEPPVEDDWPGWEERGEEVCRRVYGGQYGGLRRNVRALHPDMERWMVVEGYGKVLGRPGLDLATRELCIGALLAVLGALRQLYSHLRGALNAGAAPEEVEESLALAEGFLENSLADQVWSVWDRVRGREQGEKHTD